MRKYSVRHVKYRTAKILLCQSGSTFTPKLIYTDGFNDES